MITTGYERQLLRTLGAAPKLLRLRLAASSPATGDQLSVVLGGEAIHRHYLARLHHTTSAHFAKHTRADNVALSAFAIRVKDLVIIDWS